MLLQTLRSGTGADATVLSENPWHDSSSASGGDYRSRLQQYLGGFYDSDAKTLQPKKELLGGATLRVPDAVRLLDDAGAVVASYSLADLSRDTGLAVAPPVQDIDEGT